MDPVVAKKIADLEELVGTLQKTITNLSGDFYKNNFTSSITFNKDAVFYTRLKVPHYDSAPTVSEVGDIIEVGGVLYICTAVGGVFTKVGAQ